ncbi:MAG: hypothetical protein HQL99_05005 [Magnetococcales bacterium]|nr:hypothetical protein [Magnetococcales bacterium]
MKPGAQGWWIRGVVAATLLMTAGPLFAFEDPYPPRESGDARNDTRRESGRALSALSPVATARPRGPDATVLALNLLDPPAEETEKSRPRPPGSSSGTPHPTTKNPPVQNRSRTPALEPPPPERSTTPAAATPDRRPAKPSRDAATGSRELLDDPYFIGETPSVLAPGTDPRSPASSLPDAASGGLPGAASGLEEELDLERAMPRGGTLTLPSGPLTQPAEATEGWNPAGEWYGQDSTPWR